MRVLVTGACGQLGMDTVRALSARGHEVILTDVRPSEALPQLIAADLTKEDEVRALVASCRPDAVLHCAAWTAVDEAEKPELYDRVYEVNVRATAFLAGAAEKAGARFCYISTDYVFDGQGDTPRKPDDCAYSPLNVYGRTKLLGEEAVRAACSRYYIVRIAWVFGAHGGNFVQTMLRLGKTREELRVVNDQIGTPTYTRDLAELLSRLLETGLFGCYHVTNAELPPELDRGDGFTKEGTKVGFISWYDFAREIFRQAGYTTRVIPVSTEEYGLSRAARPRNSRLDKGRLKETGLGPLPDWRDALRRYLDETRDTWDR